MADVPGEHLRRRVRERTGVLVVLALAVAVGASVAAGLGLFAGGGEAPQTFESPRGEEVVTYGEGVYRHDSAFRGGGFRGTDAVTLALGIPFLLLATFLHARGSARGTLLLGGAFLYVLYVYASLALGAAYNDLFLLYVALFGASLFGFVRALSSVDARRLTGVALPRRAVGIFLLASGVLTAAIWLGDTVPPLVRGDTPELEGYTTLVTHALDLGLIVPGVVLAGLLVLRGSPYGLLLGGPLLVLEISLLPMIAAQTLGQLDAGVSFTTGEIAGPIGGFSLFAAAAVAALAVLLRHVPGAAAPRG